MISLARSSPLTLIESYPCMQDYVLDKSRREAHLRRQRSSHMTFATAFNCSDGLVLCADSLEADGITKRSVDKITFGGTVGRNGWSFALVGAGPGGLLDKFSKEVKSSLYSQGLFQPKEVQTAVESALSDFRSKYQEPFRVIVGVCGMHGMERHLWRSDDNYLSPINDHAHIGMGHSLWRFFTEMLYEYGNSVTDNVRLAVFIMRQAIKYVDGVDEPIQIASYKFGDEFWKAHSQQDIEAIENDFTPEKLKTTLRTYWRIHNPPTLRDQLRKYGAVQNGDEPILLEGVKLEELYTVAGRQQSSRIFRRNTDKLQQRAILEGKRYQGAQSGATQSSSRKTRT